MAKNLALLRETIEAIKAQPARHYQGAWANITYETFQTLEPCNTSMCFAGHATVINTGVDINLDLFREADWDWNVDKRTGKQLGIAEEYDEDTDEYFMPEHVVHVAEYARNILGLTEEESNYLFAGHRTLRELEEFVTKAEQGYTVSWEYRTDSGYYDYSYVKEEN